MNQFVIETVNYFYRPKKKKINNINWETDMTLTSFIAFTIMHYQTIIQVPKMYFISFMITLNYTEEITSQFDLLFLSVYTEFLLLKNLKFTNCF